MLIQLVSAYHADRCTLVIRHGIGLHIWTSILERKDVSVDQLLYSYLKCIAIVEVVTGGSFMKLTMLLEIIPSRQRNRRWTFVASGSNKSSLYQSRIQLTVKHWDRVDGDLISELVIILWDLGPL